VGDGGRLRGGAHRELGALHRAFAPRHPAGRAARSQHGRVRGDAGGGDDRPPGRGAHRPLRDRAEPLLLPEAGGRGGDPRAALVAVGADAGPSRAAANGFGRLAAWRWTTRPPDGVVGSEDSATQPAREELRRRGLLSTAALRPPPVPHAAALRGLLGGLGSFFSHGGTAPPTIPLYLVHDPRPFPRPRPRSGTSRSSSAAGGVPETIEAMYGDGVGIFVEVGPAGTSAPSWRTSCAGGRTWRSPPTP
jgi:hypothetical protein